MKNEKKKNKKKKNQLGEVWNRLKKNKIAAVALGFIVLLILVAIFADVIADYDGKVIKQNISERLQHPSAEHWFGTDAYGRDMFARVIHGSRISLVIGLISTIAAVLGGVIVGSVAGYFGGIIDNVVMRISDVFMSVPMILLSLAIVAALGPGISNLVIALAVTQIPAFGRLVRSQVISMKSSEFIEAARAIGTSNFEIISRHIVPNIIGPIIVQGTLTVATAIISAAALSYIGLGVPPPAPEWGTMLAEGREFMRQHIHMLIIPGLAIVFTALSFNLLGDGLRDALDPRLRGGGK